MTSFKVYKVEDRQRNDDTCSSMKVQFVEIHKTCRDFFGCSWD